MIKKSLLNKTVICFLAASLMIAAAMATLSFGADNSMYEPTKVIVAGGSTTVCMSWKNPVADTITKVSLYENNTGELISDSFSTAGGAVCSQKITVADWGKKYCRLVVEFSDHEAVSILLEGYAYNWQDSNSAHKTDAPFDGWALEYSASGDRAIPFEVTADKSFDNGNGHSLHISSNNSDASAVVKIRSSVKLEAGKYTVKYRKRWSDIKTEGAIKLMLGSEGDGNCHKTISYAGDAGENNSVSYDAEVTKAYAGGIFFEIGKGVMGDFWIDDLEIYKKDESGNITGGNLIPSGSFDRLKSAAPNNLENLSVKPGNGDCTASYDKPAADHINIYEKNSDGSLSLRAIIRDERTTVVLPELKNGKKYTFVFKTVNQYKMESEGTEVTVEPTPFAYYIGDKRIYKLTPGNITVKITARNSAEDKKSAALMFALYENGALKQIARDVQPVDGSGYREMFVTLNVPESGENSYSVKAFLWENAPAKLSPCAPAHELSK